MVWLFGWGAPLDQRQAPLFFTSISVRDLINLIKKQHSQGSPRVQNMQTP